MNAFNENVIFEAERSLRSDSDEDSVQSSSDDCYHSEIEDLEMECFAIYGKKVVLLDPIYSCDRCVCQIFANRLLSEMIV